MRKKSTKPLEVLPFRFLAAEIVTDPVEIAAAERMRKRLRSKKRKSNTNDDLLALRKAKKSEAKKPSPSLEETKKRLGLR